MKKAIAFFDFDGTITTKDTLVEFIRFTKGRMNFLLGFLLHAPYLVAYKLKIISNQSAKEKVLQYFFRDMPVEQFENYCRDFSEKMLPALVRPKAVEEIRKLQSQNSIVVVVSASPQNWIQPWAEANGIQLIATCLETKNGKLTGKLLGKNCHGEEKVRRIVEKHQLKDYEVIYAYGDTAGDRPMMKLATESFYRPFRD